MLLAIDVGNTHTVIGAFKNEKLVADWRMASVTNRTDDENWLTIKSFCTDAGIDVSAITGVGISSVVPDLTFVYRLLARKHFHVEPLTVSGELSLGIRIAYSDPSMVGADRICNAVAGFARYGGPLIIIDFGTATTFDVVSVTGDYLGGVITLGLESMASELHRRAAKLPRVELRFPLKVIGTDTTASMQSGLMLGTVDAVEGMVRRIREELGEPARVIATGGLSHIIARHTSVIEACEPSLVLDGIRMIYERVMAHRT
jgi:type III pantothenate kinase